MKRYWAGLMAGIVLPLAVSAQSPRLVVEESTYHFGDVQTGDVIEHVFTLNNQGDAPLHITDTRSSCGCTVAQLSSTSIEPGAQATLMARFNLAGRSGTQQSVITLTTDDPEQPTYQLSMKGQVSQPLTIRPNRIFYGQINSDTASDRVVEITYTEGNELEILSVEPTSEHLAVTFQNNVAERRHTVTIRSVPPLPQGLLQETVRLKTSNPKWPTIELPVIAQVVGALAVAPERISLMASSATPVTRYVVVRPGQAREFQILEVNTPSNTDIQVQVLKIPNQGYRIQLRNIVATEAIDGQSLVIRTDVPSMEEINVPFQLVR